MNATPRIRTAAVLLALAVSLAALAPARGGDGPSGFDTAPFDSLLALYVVDGRVDYGAWKEDGTEALDAFLASAAGYDLTSTLAKEPKAAFFTNVYNAWVIRQVLENYPVESVQDIPGFFDGNRCAAAGEERTLEEIDETLAGMLAHIPYYTLLLVPGAAGAPPLPSQALTAENYTEILNGNCQIYLNRQGRLTYDKENKVLHVPPAVGEHLDLYYNLRYGLNGFAGNYLSLGDAIALGKNEVEVVVEEIDWSLNDTATAPAAEETPGG